MDGHLGVVELGKLDPELKIEVIDNKKTGMSKCLVSVALGPETNFATLILGEDQGVEVIFTFHPGNPIRPDEIPVEKLDGRTSITVAEAIGLGFTHACIA